VAGSGERVSRQDADHLERMRHDVAEWQRQGIITAEEATAIFAYYQVPQGALRARSAYARLIAVLATLGAILVGVGAILFIASNWQDMPKFGKLALIMGGIAAAYTIGYWLRYESSYPRIGTGIIFLGTLLFGAGIFLVGQAYHMKANDPNLLFWWSIGVLPLAYFARSRAILSLAILAALGGLGWRAGSWLEEMDASVSFVVAFYAVLGPATYALGTLHARFARTDYYATNYNTIGLLVTFFALYLLSFEFVAKELLGGSYGQQPEITDGFLMATIIATVVAVTSMAASLALSALRREDRRTLLAEAIAMVAVMGSAYLFMLLPFDTAAPYIALANLVLFAVIMGAIVAGFLTRRGALVNLGIAFFALDAISRYVDVAWGMLDTSLFFMLGGVLLLGGGFLLERARRRLMERFMLVEVPDEG
jgi:uncharacterized membrane protein